MPHIGYITHHDYTVRVTTYGDDAMIEWSTDGFKTKRWKTFDTIDEMMTYLEQRLSRDNMTYLRQRIDELT